MTRSGEHDGPIRTCVGCRERRPQRDLVRCVLDADGMVHVDRHGPGRGAWLCGAGCLTEARRRGGFDRAFRRPIRPAQLEGLESELTGCRNTGTTGGGDRPQHCETKTTTKG
jgi:predicted RNA-binding protein YlxR (DUF448 family)